MTRLARHVSDKRLLRVVRAFLNAGLMQNGVVVRRTEGTPQGGPLSPLLANLLLDDLDKELERRGHRFCWYADDCNIYVQSLKVGQRVMTSINQFLERRLKLYVNRDNAWKLAGSSKGWWRMSGTLQAHLAMNVQWFEELGLVSLSSRWQMLQTEGNRRGAEQACPVV